MAGVSLRLAVICLVVGGALRFATLDLQSFDHDESVTVGRVLAPGLDDTLAILPESERTPPLFYVLAWTWTRVFGTGEVGVRSFSALVGTLAIAVGFFAVRRLLGARAGVIAAALFAVNPLLIWNAQDARSHSLGILLVAAALWAFAAARERPTARRVAAFAVLGALAGATHYFTWFVIAPMAVSLLLRAPRSRPTWAALAALVIFAAALLPLAYVQAATKQGGEADFGQGDIVRRLAVTVAQFTVGENPTIPGAQTVDTTFRAAGVVVAALVLAGLLLALHARARRPAARLAVALAACGVLVPALLAVAGFDFYNGRNAMFALVPLLAAVAVGFACPPDRLRRQAHAGLAALVAVQLGVVLAATQLPTLQRSDWRAAAAMIGALRPGEVVLPPAGGDDPLRLYLDAVNAPEAGVPATRAIVVSDLAEGTPEIVEHPPEGFILDSSAEHDGIGLYRLTSERARRPISADWRTAAPESTAVLVARSAGAVDLAP
jgi:4-amino-4-deoxy-L-arabinose transferase-like glycosyltransferase